MNRKLGLYVLVFLSFLILVKSSFALNNTVFYDGFTVEADYNNDWYAGACKNTVWGEDYSFPKLAWRTGTVYADQINVEKWSYRNFTPALELNNSVWEIRLPYNTGDHLQEWQGVQISNGSHGFIMRIGSAAGVGHYVFGFENDSGSITFLYNKTTTNILNGTYYAGQWENGTVYLMNGSRDIWQTNVTDLQINDVQCVSVSSRFSGIHDYVNITTSDDTTPPVIIYNVSSFINSINQNYDSIDGYCNVTSTNESGEYELKYSWYKNGGLYKSEVFNTNMNKTLNYSSVKVIGISTTPERMYDRNFDTFANPNTDTQAFLLLNYTIDDINSTIYITYKWWIDAQLYSSSDIRLSCYNYSINGWSTLDYQSTGGDPLENITTILTPKECYNNSFLQINVSDFYIHYETAHGVFSKLYEVQVNNTNFTLFFNQSYLIDSLYNNTDYGYNDSVIFECGVSNESFIYCYQETANVSNDCGGLNTGVYGNDTNWRNNEYNITNAWDGDHTTRALISCAGTGYFYVNYTIPAGVENATWLYNASIGLSGDLHEYDIPSSCLEGDTLILRSKTFCDLPSGGYTNYTCSDTSGNWLLLDTDYDDRQGIYEEGVLWENNLNILAISNSSNYTIDQISPVINDVTPQIQTVFFPEVLDNYSINITAYDTMSGIKNCSFYVNTTGEYLYNLTGNYIENNIFNFIYRIPNVNLTYRNFSYYFICYDYLNNNKTSGIYNVSIKDITYPVFVLNDNNGFKANNQSVISSYLYDLQLNISIFDYNLFQALINITCDINESLYYEEMLDINSSNYNFTTKILLRNQTPQKCTVFLSASDDHTLNKIGKYDVEKLEDGLKYQTLERNNIEILTKDDTSWFDGIDSEKSDDRYSFEFKFKEEKDKREFKVKADNKIYFRNESEYPAHFVVWNNETKRGNWIDFVDIDNDIDKYSVIKISDYEYDVVIESKQAKKEMFFNSLGGTNILNVSYVFYIGGTVNVSIFNYYDNSSVDNFSVYIESINSSVYVNETVNISNGQGYIGNLSNGSYNFLFMSDGYFNKTYSIIINSNYTEQVYNTSQSIVNILIRNIATGNYIKNFNVIINNTDSGQIDSFNSNNNTRIAIRYINASNYTIFITSASYENFSSSFLINNYENLTLTYDMNFFANFILLDERTLGVFNISGADRVNFLLFCPNGTYTTLINETTVVLPINCNYEKFKFVLDYGITSYYRTFILEPDEALNVSVYLIDGTTTQYIYNSLVIDDLLDKYDNPAIYVNKVIGNSTSQITADYVDIENKIGAYLIESNEYIIELHSSNQPTRILGRYSADLAGTKSIRLYEITLEPEESSYINGVKHIVGIENRTTDMYAVMVYNDSLNQTSSVVWTLYQNTYGGTILNTQSSSESNVEMEFNLTPFYNSTVISMLDITHSARSYTSGKILREVTEITLDILSYISQNFLNWFFTLLLGVLAIMATIRTANMVSISMVGLASLFVIFGWYKLSWGTLTLAIIFALLNLLKEGEKN